jgi:thioredoxin-related protein
LKTQMEDMMIPYIQLNFFQKLTGLTLMMIAMVSMGTGQTDEKDSFEWITLEVAQEAAVNDGKKIMVFIEAEWCGFCRQMEQNVFPEAKIQKIVDEMYHPVTIDLDSGNAVHFNGQQMTEREFARAMNVSATPTFLFINPGGDVLAHQVGYNPADRFEALLLFIYADEFGEISFEEYFQMYSKS